MTNEEFYQDIKLFNGKYITSLYNPDDNTQEQVFEDFKNTKYYNPLKTYKLFFNKFLEYDIYEK